MDFCIVPTVSFQLLYAWFVIDHGRRRLIHFNVTTNPSARWVIQQLREAFPSDRTPRYLLLDRDSIFSAEVIATMRSFGAEPLRTAYRSPRAESNRVPALPHRQSPRFTPCGRSPPSLRLGGGGVGCPRVHPKASIGPVDEF